MTADGTLINPHCSMIVPAEDRSNFTLNPAMVSSPFE